MLQHFWGHGLSIEVMNPDIEKKVWRGVEWKLGICKLGRLPKHVRTSREHCGMFAPRSMGPAPRCTVPNA